MSLAVMDHTNFVNPQAESLWKVVPMTIPDWVDKTAPIISKVQMKAISIMSLLGSGISIDVFSIDGDLPEHKTEPKMLQWGREILVFSGKDASKHIINLSYFLDENTTTYAYWARLKEATGSFAHHVTAGKMNAVFNTLILLYKSDKSTVSHCWELTNCQVMGLTFSKMNKTGKSYMKLNVELAYESFYPSRLWMALPTMLLSDTGIGSEGGLLTAIPPGDYSEVSPAGSAINLMHSGGTSVLGNALRVARDLLNLTRSYGGPGVLQETEMDSDLSARSYKSQQVEVK